MLTSVSGLQALVLDRYDLDTLFIGRGAPHRWADPGAGSGGGYGVQGVASRFGVVTWHQDAAVAQAGGGHTVHFTCTFTPSFTPGVTPTPAIVLRLRSPVASEALVGNSVAVAGDAALVSLDEAAGDVQVSLPPPASTSYTFAVKALFQ
jgi:hypothetical protein